MNVAMSVVEHWPVILGLGFCPQYCKKQRLGGGEARRRRKGRMLTKGEEWKEKDIVIDNTLTKQNQRSNEEPDYFSYD